MRNPTSAPTPRNPAAKPRRRARKPRPTIAERVAKIAAVIRRQLPRRSALDYLTVERLARLYVKAEDLSREIDNGLRTKLEIMRLERKLRDVELQITRYQRALGLTAAARRANRSAVAEDERALAAREFRKETRLADPLRVLAGNLRGDDPRDPLPRGMVDNLVRLRRERLGAAAAKPDDDDENA